MSEGGAFRRRALGTGIDDTRRGCVPREMLTSTESWTTSVTPPPVSDTARGRNFDIVRINTMIITVFQFVDEKYQRQNRHKNEGIASAPPDQDTRILQQRHRIAQLLV